MAFGTQDIAGVDQQVGGGDIQVSVTGQDDMARMKLLGRSQPRRQVGAAAAIEILHDKADRSFAGSITGRHEWTAIVGDLGIKGDGERRAVLQGSDTLTQRLSGEHQAG